MGERMIEDFSSAHSLSYICLRYFNAAGADPEGEIGEAHTPETHLIPSALLTLIKKETPFLIYGTDHPTPDGTTIRDYIHVTDIAEAHVKGLLYLLGYPKQALTLNLGSGKGYSLIDVLNTIQSVTGTTVAVKPKPAIKGDPSVLVADAKKASSLLNWQTRYSDLETIIGTAWRWHTHSN
jgi:UDP-glucose 4-epimerase